MAEASRLNSETGFAGPLPRIRSLRKPIRLSTIIQAIMSRFTRAWDNDGRNLEHNLDGLKQHGRELVDRGGYPLLM